MVSARLQAGANLMVSYDTHREGTWRSFILGGQSIKAIDVLWNLPRIAVKEICHEIHTQ